MAAEKCPIKRVSILAHPMLVVFFAAASITLGGILTFSAHVSPPAIRRSLLLSLWIWVPYIGYLKWVFRKNIAFYAAIYANGWLPRTIDEQMRHLRISMPPLLVLFFVMPWLTHGYERWDSGPMMVILGVLMISVYPEQKAIWEAAKALVDKAQ